MQPKRRSLTVVTLGAALTLAAACGGGDDGSSSNTTAPIETTTSESTTTTEAPLTLDEASERYETCLTDNGSGPDEIPVDQPLDDLAQMGDRPESSLKEMGIEPTFIPAHIECWPAFSAALDEIPASEMPTTSTTVDAEKAAQMHGAVECLNDRGWDFLEPGVETGPLTMQPRDADFDWDNEAFLADQYDCQRLQGMMG